MKSLLSHEKMWACYIHFYDQGFDANVTSVFKSQNFLVKVGPVSVKPNMVLDKSGKCMAECSNNWNERKVTTDNKNIQSEKLWIKSPDR